MRYAILIGLVIGSIGGSVFPISVLLQKKEPTVCRFMMPPELADEIVPVSDVSHDISESLSEAAVAHHEIEEDESVGLIDPVQHLPRFNYPQCESMENPDDRKICAEQAMLAYVYQRIKYPAEARENCIEGMVVISFVVGKEGTITDPKIVRDLAGGCGQVAFEVVKSMPDWIPGTQNFKVVSTQFNLPIKFKLEY